MSIITPMIGFLFVLLVLVFPALCGCIVGIGIAQIEIWLEDKS